MRSIILLISMMLFVQSLEAQIADNTEANDSTNIYYQALERYCESIEELDTSKSQLLVEANSLVTNSLPNKFGKIKVSYINVYEIKSTLKKEKVELIRIIPLRVKDGHFFINIIPFSVSYEKKNFNFVNSGGTRVVFEYNDTMGKFIFKEFKQSGI